VCGIYDLVTPLVHLLKSNFIVYQQSSITPSSDVLFRPKGVGGSGTAAVLVRAWPNDKSIILNATKVVVMLTNFSGFDSLVGSDERVREEVSTSNRRYAAATTWHDGSQLLLGCNLWNGELFPNVQSSWDALEGIPIWARHYKTVQQLQVFANLSNSSSTVFRCAYVPDRLFSATSTATASLSQPVKQPPPYLTLPTVSPNTVVIALSAFDGIELIALGQSSCGPAELKKATSDSRFLISPFFDFGGDVSTLGNLGLLLLIAVAHGLLVLRKRRCNVQQTKKDLHSQNHQRSLPTTLLARRRTRSWWMATPEAAGAHFPNLTIAAALYILNGVSFTAANAVTSGSMGSALFTESDDRLRWLSVCFGTAGIALLLALLVGYVYVMVLHPNHFDLTKHFRFFPYSSRARRTSALPDFAIPFGQWGPDEWRQSLGKLKSLVRAGRNPERCAMLPVFVAWTSNLLLGFEGPASVWCAVQWSLLCVMTLAAGGTVACIRPARTPIVNVLLVIQYVLQSLVYALSALLQSRVGERDTVIGVLMASALLSTLISIAKTGHNIAIFFWERRHNVVTGETFDCRDRGNRTMIPRQAEANKYRTRRIDSHSVDPLYLMNPRAGDTRNMRGLESEILPSQLVMLRSLLDVICCSGSHER
jgi:hypothetical protein